jgi:ribonuclease HI
MLALTPHMDITTMTVSVCLSASAEGPVAYTDGACLGNPGPGGWGVRIYFADGAIQELGGAARATTNNRMELQAAIEALKVIDGSAHGTVYTDSRYVIDGLTKWLATWRRRGWVTTAHTPVKNRDLWVTLEQYQHRGIAWKHVRGHSGDPNNERVDSIARAFAAGKIPQLFSGACGSPLDPVQPQAALACPTTLATSTEPSPRGAPVVNGMCYVSIVYGVPLLHRHWGECAARVQGVAGARYKKVRTEAELISFCEQHGVSPPAAG